MQLGQRKWATIWKSPVWLWWIAAFYFSKSAWRLAAAALVNNFTVAQHRYYENFILCPGQIIVQGSLFSSSFFLKALGHVKWHFTWFYITRTEFFFVQLLPSKMLQVPWWRNFDCSCSFFLIVLPNLRVVFEDGAVSSISVLLLFIWTSLSVIVSLWLSFYWC